MSGLFKTLQNAREYLKNQGGLAYIEFAFVVPILLLLFYGCIEVSRLFLILQKVEKTSMMVANITSQFNTTATPAQPSAADLAQLMNIVPYLLEPYGAPAKQYVILSDVSVPVDSTTPQLNWQSCGGGTFTQTSALGEANGSATPATATLPAGFSLDPGKEEVFAEVYFSFSPLLVQNLVSPIKLYRIFGFTPRNGFLQNYRYTCL